jgi:hypothetical protein
MSISADTRRARDVPDSKGLSPALSLPSDSSAAGSPPLRCSFSEASRDSLTQPF